MLIGELELKGENYYAVILAGGGGTRLWPLSRQDRPKQTLSLVGDSTLFQLALRRLGQLFPPTRILVVTNHKHYDELRRQAPLLDEGNFIQEPDQRGTAAAIGLAAAFLESQDPGCSMAVVTADHFIGNQEEFERNLLAAFELAEQDLLVTLGIEPTFPATQFGYIQVGASLGSFGRYSAFHVQRFKEKPSGEEAASMLKEGNYVWNSGMFIWKVERIMAEFQRQMPELYNALQRISTGWGNQDFDKILASEWQRLAVQTIDYGVMEHAKNVAVIPVKGLIWNDVGSWSSLFEMLKSDASGNLVLCKLHLDMGSRNLLLFSKDQERMIVTVGVENLVAIDTGDVLLLCSMERAQDIREVTRVLKEKGLDKYL